MLPAPAISRKGSSKTKVKTVKAKRVVELKWDDKNDKSWKARFARIRRKLLSASSPSNSLNVGSSAASSDHGGERNLQALKEAQEQYAKEDEMQDWTTEKVVVDSDDEGDHGGAFSEDNSNRPTSGRTRSRTGGYDGHEQTPSDAADDFRFSGDFMMTMKGYMMHFFDPRFPEDEPENQFQKERWYNTKPLAMATCLFLVLNWVLYLIFNHSVSLYEKIAYYGVATFFTVPLPLFVAFDFPRKRNFFFQTWLMISTWQWGISENIQIKVCHFYEPGKNCGAKDFLFMMTYSIALPALVLFACNQKRAYATFAAVVQFCLLSALILPHQEIFVRNVVSFIVFSAFFIWIHYYQEQIDRRMFVLRAQLKISYKAQQKAQIAQKQAANSKRRFISYIFHEVRVPLNSAMLAFQNLQTNSAFKHVEDDQAVEVHALEGSMAAMKQVLDDVLDLQRMDSGRFEHSPQPFPFHRTLQSMLGTLKVAAAAKNLKLNIELDEKIDHRRFKNGKDEGTWVVGDSLRLRQVLTNLTSNAVKFTPEGEGEITVKTTLVEDSISEDSEAPVSPTTPGPTISRPSLLPRTTSFISSRFSERNVNTSSTAVDQEKEPKPPRKIVIRIEVTDAGPGIRPSDADQLFEPFVQTKLGVAQAGKGSGLGLAIVRQIVTLSGGRLGFRSRKNVGSTFWVEFTYELATDTQIQEKRDATGGGIIGTSLKGSPATEGPPQPQRQLHTPTEISASTTLAGSSSSAEKIDPLAQINFAPALISTSKTYSPYFDRVPPGVEVISLGEATVIPPLIKAHTSPPPPALPENTPSEKPASPPSVTPTPASPPPTTSPPEDKPLKVLVVDDDNLTRTLMSRMLTRMGCIVSTANDGQQALDILLESPTPPFDMVSLDNAMPVLTGQQAVKRLRAMDRKDFIVGATGNALKSDQIAYLEAGADHVLSKPVTLKDLKAVLQLALERRDNAASSADKPPDS